MKKVVRPTTRVGTKAKEKAPPTARAKAPRAKVAPKEQVEPVVGAEDLGEFVPYDENLLERVRIQWQFGDWDSLASLGRETLQHHPDRAKLALLAAAGRLQCGDTPAARSMIRLARDWGCSKRLVSQVLVAGVYNSLGRAAAIVGHGPRALRHFENAVEIGSTGSEIRLLTRARINEQLSQIGAAASALQISADSPVAAVSLATTFAKTLQDVARRLKDEIKSDINVGIRANNPNPYVHNRTLTLALNHDLREFAATKLGRQGLKAAYVDYLAAKAIQIERNCVGRLATTVQDAVARQLAAECVPGEQLCILEIGALYGVSLALLYNHSITRYRQVQVVCLDPFDGYYGNALDAVLNQPVNNITFRRNMSLANVPEHDYALIQHYSTEPAAVAAARGLRFNLLVIDGDHSYDGVKFDFDNYFPLLQPGGYVIFDDYNDAEYPGVQRLVDEDLASTPDLEYLGAVAHTAVARKREQAGA